MRASFMVAAVMLAVVIFCSGFVYISCIGPPPDQPAIDDVYRQNLEKAKKRSKQHEDQLSAKPAQRGTPSQT